MDLLTFGGLFIAGLILGALLNRLMQRPQNCFILISTAIFLVSTWPYYDGKAEFFTGLIFFCLLITAAFIDFEALIIPNQIIVVGLISGFMVQIFFFRGQQLLDAGAGAISAATFLYLLRVLSRGGVGNGDIKFALVIGFFLGWPIGLFAIILACFLAGIVGMGLLLSGKKTRKDLIPFGPFLSISALFSYFKGAECFAWYTTWLGF